MNKNELKKFASSLRKELIGEIKSKINYIVSLEDDELPAFYRNHLEKVKHLKQEYSKYGLDILSEKIAYTWANRLMALRYLDIKGFNETMIITPKDGEVIPEIFSLAKSGVIEDGLILDKKHFFDLIDGKIKADDAQNEAYAMLFLAYCNSFSNSMPFLFERIGDYRELLLPNDLLSKNSIRHKVVEGIKAEDVKDVEIIGWFYQFYISEKKDEVFANLKKNKKITPSNIPAATQLFTPHWIVKYLVENSLGKLWMLNHPKSSLKDHMKYYIETDDISDFIKVSSPEELTFLDPCCGSGHMLTYAFDLLTKIYEEEGYRKSEIPALILTKNLYGCDIDERAANLSSFALTMKSREYCNRFFKKPVLPNVVALRDYNLSEFENIDNYGSLIKIDECQNPKDDIFSRSGFNQYDFDIQCKILSSQFHCTVTNPPYMGSKGMNKELSDFVKTHYPDSKSDLFSAFIERCLNFTKDEGFTAMITMQSWMFLSSFEKLRAKLLKNYSITTMAHLDNMVMGIAFGTSATVWNKKRPDENTKAIYFKINLDDLDANREIRGLR